MAHLIRAAYFIKATQGVVKYCQAPRTQGNKVTMLLCFSASFLFCYVSKSGKYQPRMTAQEYRKMLEVDFDDTNISEMPDLAKLKINPDKSQIERQKEYLKKVGNPYMVRVGNMKIKVRFANNGISFNQAFENLLLNI